ncbi:MAG: zinc-dependent alcohol dehydrogenase family protein [Novosphingobium sp.]
MAKVARFHRFGGPEVMQVDDIRVGDPSTGEVRIRVGAMGLNRVETMVRSGAYGEVALPSKLGYEAAGVIEALGPDVSGWAIGDRVATLFGLPMDIYGTYGTQILYPADMLVRVADSMSLTAAAASWMQYGTAYALIDLGQIKPGDHVVINAASSSVGLAAIQIARHHQAVPIAVTRGRGKAGALLAHGAAHVIVSDEQDVPARIREVTGGAGAQIAFDAVAGAALAGLLSAMAPRGVVIVYGMLGGYSFEMSLPLLMGGNLALHGFAANRLIEVPADRARLVAYIEKGLASGALSPVIDRTFDLADIVNAHRYLESNVQFGKIVLTTASAGE